MKITEAKDGFLKIESDEKVTSSSFIEIDGLSKKYIAQVIQSKLTDDGYNIFAKILFNYDGTLISYDKTLPDFDASLKNFSMEIINKSFVCDNPIIAGKFIEDGTNISLDESCFNNFLISVDNPQSNNIITSNIVKQFKNSKKVVVIDMTGVLNAKKYVAGVDFKLPLNTESLNFMYEDCLSDATYESKSLIKDIFEDLSEYSKTVEFLPFETLKTIVDDMVENSHIFKLLVLKNKLEKFMKQGYFASSKKESERLSEILNSELAIIDISKLDSVFQNRYLEVILSELKHFETKPQVFIEVSNTINKKNLKTILGDSEINSTFITHSKFKYLAELKPFFKNFILESSFSNKEIFKTYSLFLNTMNSEEYLLLGEGTNYIPLISKLIPYSDIVDKKENVNKINSEQADEIVEILEQALVNEVSDFSEQTSGTESEEPVKIEENETCESENELDTETTDEEKSQDEESPDSSNYHTNIHSKNLFVIDDEDDNAEEENCDETENDNDESVDESDIDNNFTEEEISEGAELDKITEQNEPEESSANEVILSEDSVASEEIEEETNDEESSEEIEIPSELEIDELPDFEEEEEEEDTEKEFVIEDNSEETPVDEEGIVDTESQEPIIIPIDTEYENETLGEIIEINDNEFQEGDVIVSMDEDELDETLLRGNENLDQEIKDDVDRVFSTIKDDTISDSDLDLIDELNDSDVDTLLDIKNYDSDILQELEEDSEDGMFIEPLEEISDSDKNDNGDILETRSSSTPIVPVYDAEIPSEDIVSSDSIEQGDTVTHVKFGTGVVEKMVPYGNKKLCFINFDNVGRRLLDPTLTEIKKA